MNEHSELSPRRAHDLEIQQFITDVFLPMLCPLGHEHYDFQLNCLPGQQPAFLRGQKLLNLIKEWIKDKTPYEIAFLARALVYGGLNWVGIPDLGAEGILLTGEEALFRDKKVIDLVSSDIRLFLDNLLEEQNLDDKVHACYQRTLLSHLLLFCLKHELLSDEWPYKAEFPHSMIENLLCITELLLKFPLNYQISDQRLATSFMLHEIIELPEVSALSELPSFIDRLYEQPTFRHCYWSSLIFLQIKRVTLTQYDQIIPLLSDITHKGFQPLLDIFLYDHETSTWIMRLMSCDNPEPDAFRRRILFLLSSLTPSKPILNSYLIPFRILGKLLKFHRNSEYMQSEYIRVVIDVLNQKIMEEVLFQIMQSNGNDTEKRVSILMEVREVIDSICADLERRGIHEGLEFIVQASIRENLAKLVGMRKPVLPDDNEKQYASAFIANTILPIIYSPAEEGDIDLIYLFQRRDWLINAISPLLTTYSTRFIIYLVRSIVYGLVWEGLPVLNQQGIWVVDQEAAIYDQGIREAISQDKRNVIENLLERHKTNDQTYTSYLNTVFAQLLLFSVLDLLCSDSHGQWRDFPSDMIGRLLSITQELLKFPVVHHMSEWQRQKAGLTLHTFVYEMNALAVKLNPIDGVKAGLIVSSLTKQYCYRRLDLNIQMKKNIETRDIYTILVELAREESGLPLTTLLTILLYDAELSNALAELIAKDTPEASVFKRRLLLIKSSITPQQPCSNANFIPYRFLQAMIRRYYTTNYLNPIIELVREELVKDENRQDQAGKDAFRLIVLEMVEILDIYSNRLKAKGITEGEIFDTLNYAQSILEKLQEKTDQSAVGLASSSSEELRSVQLCEALDMILKTTFPAPEEVLVVKPVIDPNDFTKQFCDNLLTCLTPETAVEQLSKLTEALDSSFPVFNLIQLAVKLVSQLSSFWGRVDGLAAIFSKIEHSGVLEEDILQLEQRIDKYVKKLERENPAGSVIVSEGQSMYKPCFVALTCYLALRHIFHTINKNGLNDRIVTELKPLSILTMRLFEFSILDRMQPEERKSMGRFIGLIMSGNPVFKPFAEAVKELFRYPIPRYCFFLDQARQLIHAENDDAILPLILRYHNIILSMYNYDQEVFYQLYGLACQNNGFAHSSIVRLLLMLDALKADEVAYYNFITKIYKDLVEKAAPNSPLRNPAIAFLLTLYLNMPATQPNDAVAKLRLEKFTSGILPTCGLDLALAVFYSTNPRLMEKPLLLEILRNTNNEQNLVTDWLNMFLTPLVSPLILTGFYNQFSSHIANSCAKEPSILAEVIRMFHYNWQLSESPFVLQNMRTLADCVVNSVLIATPESIEQMLKEPEILKPLLMILSSSEAYFPVKKLLLRQDSIERYPRDYFAKIAQRLTDGKSQVGKPIHEHFAKKTVLESKAKIFYLLHKVLSYPTPQPFLEPREQETWLNWLRTIVVVLQISKRAPIFMSELAKLDPKLLLQNEDTDLTINSADKPTSTQVVNPSPAPATAQRSKRGQKLAAIQSPSSAVDSPSAPAATQQSQQGKNTADKPTPPQAAVVQEAAAAQQSQQGKKQADKPTPPQAEVVQEAAAAQQSQQGKKRVDKPTPPQAEVVQKAVVAQQSQQGKKQANKPTPPQAVVVQKAAAAQQSQQGTKLADKTTLTQVVNLSPAPAADTESRRGGRKKQAGPPQAVAVQQAAAAVPEGSRRGQNAPPPYVVLAAPAAPLISGFSTRFADVVAGRQGIPLPVPISIVPPCDSQVIELVPLEKNFLAFCQQLTNYLQNMKAVPAALGEALLKINLDGIREALKKPTAYQQLESHEQKQIEEQWNHFLAEQLWSLKGSLDSHEIEDALKERVNRVLIELCYCYYKSWDAHLNRDHLEGLRALANLFQLPYCLRGSLFFDPENPADYDLAFEGNTSQVLSTFSGRRALSPVKGYYCEPLGGLTCADGLVVQRVGLKMPNGSQIGVDIISGLELSGEPGINDALRARVDVGACNWFPTGLTCIPPKPARSIFSNVFSVLVKDVGEFEQYSGYILGKYLKVAGPETKLDEMCQAFFDKHFFYDTCLANQISTSKSDLENTHTILRNTLRYLFDRFGVRTAKTIDFILRNRVLTSLFSPSYSATPSSSFGLANHIVYTQYFNVHFMQNGVPNDLSGPVFLAMYFISNIIGPSAVDPERFFQELASAAHGSLKNTVDMVVKILRRIPAERQEEQIEVEFRRAEAQLRPGKYIDDSLKIIFSHWQSGIQSNAQPQDRAAIRHGAYRQTLFALPQTLLPRGPQQDRSFGSQQFGKS